jgi:ABC-type nitrate/sulfonate/bicarbonate transport system substrate-binding protein
MHTADPTNDQLRGNIIINDHESPPREPYKFTLFFPGNKTIATILRHNTFNTKLQQALSKQSLQPNLTVPLTMPSSDSNASNNGKMDFGGWELYWVHSIRLQVRLYSDMT